MAILLQEKNFGPNVIYYVFVTNIYEQYRQVNGNFVGGKAPQRYGAFLRCRFSYF